ncbi:hypothetical protein D0Z00_000114 [Geotrichum galactomycetum]|uniref:Uncharacterized protein n=1 Tax=Geotrichum galactomycetum TaxID=27317 RepID=A0ACB6VB33_9ASCO|nr:hypothetical protein D0Z00_000114 [Geotrichum candidum]
MSASPVSPDSSFYSSQDMQSASSPITITTTIGSGPNKRKEVMTLPLPPGALPPRKRAKTKDEKEQRRIERIMRNRQAAHASREKKRRHVEDLETKCVSLSSENQTLYSQIDQLSSNFNSANDYSSFLKSKLESLLKLVDSAKADSKSLESIDTDSLLKEVEEKKQTYKEVVVVPPPVSTSTPLTSSTTTENTASTSQEEVSTPSNQEQQNDISDTVSETGSLPSLSSSVANSPTSSSLDIMIKSEDEDDDNVYISLPDDVNGNYPLFGTQDFLSHHPAAVMCI